MGQSQYSTPPLPQRSNYQTVLNKNHNVLHASVNISQQCAMSETHSPYLYNLRIVQTTKHLQSSNILLQFKWHIFSVLTHKNGHCKLSLTSYSTYRCSNAKTYPKVCKWPIAEYELPQHMAMCGTSSTHTYTITSTQSILKRSILFLSQTQNIK